MAFILGPDTDGPNPQDNPFTELRLNIVRFLLSLVQLYGVQSRQKGSLCHRAHISNCNFAVPVYLYTSRAVQLYNCRQLS